MELAKDELESMLSQAWLYTPLILTLGGGGRWIRVLGQPVLHKTAHEEYAYVFDSIPANKPKHY